MAWATSCSFVDRTVTEVLIFLDTLWAGLIPPFSTFFNAVLSHYQIHMLHLGPQSIVLLVVFAFVCEAMVGIAPSMALLRHFFSLHLTDPRQCSGCLSFQAVAATAGSGIDFELPPSASGFRTRWVFVDVGVLNPLSRPLWRLSFLAPAGATRSSRTPALPSSGSG